MSMRYHARQDHTPRIFQIGGHYQVPSVYHKHVCSRSRSTGPGQATMPMLDMGAHVTAVEPGANLADLLIQHAAGKPLRVIVATFEHAVAVEESSDLVVSATAFHWVDTAVGLAKAAAALHDQGWLALWWTVFGDQSRPDPFHARRVVSR